MKKYSDNFYRNMKDGAASNLTSANTVVPFLLKIFPDITSVVDVGCGIGAWASAFFMGGVLDIIGLDGEWVSANDLIIAKSQFRRCDLEEKIEIGRRFDLAISTEVGEHLSPGRADSFVEDMTRLSDIVVFGAAITNQGGTHHMNEQRQSYWKKKFENQGYVAFDLIRPAFQNNPKVLYEYTQNTLIYVKQEKIERYDYLKARRNIKFVTDIISPMQGTVKSSHSWKYIRHVQYLVIRAAVKKFLKR